VFYISKKVLSYLEENITTTNEDFSVFFKGLLRIKGLGVAKSALLAATYELSSRLVGDKTRVIKNAMDILPFISYLALMCTSHILDFKDFLAKKARKSVLRY